MQIPQLNQMTSYPSIQTQPPLVQHNPLSNSSHDVSGRDRTIPNAFNESLRSQEHQYIKYHKKK